MCLETCRQQILSFLVKEKDMILIILDAEIEGMLNFALGYGLFARKYRQSSRKEKQMHRLINRDELENKANPIHLRSRSSSNEINNFLIGQG